MIVQGRLVEVAAGLLYERDTLAAMVRRARDKIAPADASTISEEF